jgi:hypothetical protein
LLQYDFLVWTSLQNQQQQQKKVNLGVSWAMTREKWKKQDVMSSLLVHMDGFSSWFASNICFLDEKLQTHTEPMANEGFDHAF